MLHKNTIYKSNKFKKIILYPNRNIIPKIIPIHIGYDYWLRLLAMIIGYDYWL